MGFLVYGGREYEFEDRVLVHLREAIRWKFRRRECFHLTWSTPASAGSGRTTLWMTPHAELGFRFTSPERPGVDPAWAISLAALANTPGGIVLPAEHVPRGDVAR